MDGETIFILTLLAVLVTLGAVLWSWESYQYSKMYYRKEREKRDKL